tara:strand:- start:2133 stop:2468 length:336 start_codon:yes stop_codon:yes gene_type:complete
METPHTWLVVKIGKEDPFYKVFATWRGGYLDGDSWKMNSGIAKVEESDDTYDFYGESGSCYRCSKNGYGSSSYTQGVLDNVIEKAKEIGTVIEIMDIDTNWGDLLKKKENI